MRMSWIYSAGISLAAIVTSSAASAKEPTPTAELPSTAGAQASTADAQGTTISADDERGATIIVTGTRRTGLAADDSPAPVQVLSSDALSRVGQPNLNQALTQIVPSFSAESFGFDAGNLALSARLRGLNPNQTLILINGKRRHGTSILKVAAGPYQGSAAPDLDLIPPAAISRIEILQDGAAAQYGSDAIAGVINIILKSDTHGGTASLTGGSYYQGGGDTFAQTARIALPIGAKGYFNLTAFHRFHDFSQQGGADNRLVDPNGTPLAGTPAAWQLIPGYPNLNRIIGDSRSHLTTGIYNAGYDFGEVELYSFGSYGRRVAQSYQNYRLPNRVTRTVGGNVITPFPQGFSPKEGLVEDDYAVTGGIKGDHSGWKWDLSASYGKDESRISTLDSANISLYQDTGFTPRDFYDGSFISSQFVANLDISRQVDLNLAMPVNLALGAEYRRDTYEIKSGDAASIYKEGGQGFPGFQPTDAGRHSRRGRSGYIDVSINPVEAWTVDLAARYEHYSDFGSTQTGKITTRYDVSPAFAVRGTVSTGFRAPTLAEEFYSTTTVSPSFAIVLLPANSNAATILGFGPLKPEKSTNFSAGFVVHPAPSVTITIDAYQISIRDRITATGLILGQVGPFVINQRVLDAIAAHGNVLDPAIGFVGASVFTNGVNVRTRGVDFTLDYGHDVGIGRLNWSLAANYNRAKITKNRLSNALFDASARSYLETASPRYKVGLGALFRRGPLTVNVRETIYGPTSASLSPNFANYYKTKVGMAGITDLELGYELGRRLELSVGANNLFNKRPPVIELIPGTSNPITGVVYDSPLPYSPYGINGGYYYGRVTLDF